MANEGTNKTSWRSIAISLLVSAVVAFICAATAVNFNLTNTLNEAGRTTTASFTAIMDEYLRAFEQYEQVVQVELSTGAYPDEIATFLKSKDTTFANIEGDDYDGVYLYYQGRYLYSWDTPLSEYEQNEYVATERPWYTGAQAQKGGIYFSVPYRSFANDYLLSTLSRMQPDGTTVIAYDIKLGTVSKFIDQLDVVHGSTVMLIDADGNIIGSTDQTYDGQNLLKTDDQYDAEIAKARENLAFASDHERADAQKVLDSVEATKTMVSGHRHCLEDMLASPGSLVWDFGCGTVGLVQGNERYSTVTIIPFGGFLVQFLLFWLGVWVFLAACVLVVENIAMRHSAAKETEATNARLEKAIDAANAANGAKSQFLARMSHEIRTPLNVIIGLTGIAKAEMKSPDTVADCLTKIDSSSHVLLGIINDILDMSAIDSGKLKIDSARFDFQALISTLTAMFHEQASQKGVDFRVHLNGVTEEAVVGDELRVNQILMNLLSNAVKFTPAGGRINLTVIQASRSRGKVQMRFIVSDTGCGMSEEMLDRLFTPFEQESASTAREHGGSGLGLSIAKRLADKMGGTMGVQSAQGKGTSFTVDIPFILDEDTQESMPVWGFSKVRTLVVDDDEVSCKYCSTLLERLGVRSDYVVNPEEALDALVESEDKGDPYNLCIIDWRMPGMTGGELTKKIRDIFGDSSFVIIASAYDLNEVEATGRELGANYFVPKPLFQSTLFNALMHITNKDNSSRDEETAAENIDFSGKRVLVAEDVGLNMLIVVNLLEKAGLQVAQAVNGRQAVDLFEQSHPGTFDCILLDINMPIMDGYEAARAIRSSNRSDAQSMPIYAVTANAFSSDVTAALDAGMNGHIAKPIEVDVLYKTLEKAFKAAAEAN